MLKFKKLSVRIAKIIEEDKWINTDEVAEYLGVKATIIYEWIKKTMAYTGLVDNGNSKRRIR